MAHSVNIFVASALPLEGFVKELERLLEIELSRFTSEEDIWYEGKAPNIFLDVLEHDLENDRDLLFENYRQQISVAADYPWDPRAREKARNDYAYWVFRKLKALGKYNLLMTDNVSRKLEEFHPTKQM